MRSRALWPLAVVVGALAVWTAGAPPAEAGPRARRGKTEIPREDVVARLDGVLKTGLNTITADAVAQLLLDGDPANDPFLLDVRDPRDFRRGHIPGAVNVPLRKLATKWARKRSLIPADRDVVVVGYYGGDANLASLVVNAVRIEDPGNASAYRTSKALFMGMMAWSFDPAHSNGHRYDTDLGSMRVDRATETTANTPGAFDAPRQKRLRARSLEDGILSLAKVAFRKARRPNDLQVPATSLAALFDGGATPQILSVRGGGDYAKGHIPGAINVGWKDVALEQNAAKLDPGQPVYVYCYTGHTGSLAASALRLLGYDARNVLYGMCGWRPASAVSATQLLNFDLNRAWDFPIDDGGPDDLGTLAAYAPPTGCVACHTSLTGIFYDRSVANPPPALPAPPSVGEG